MTMSQIEGFTSLSALDRRSAEKYHLFILVNVFFGSVVTGTAFQQLQKFLNEPSTEYVRLSSWKIMLIFHKSSLEQNILCITETIFLIIVKKIKNLESSIMFNFNLLIKEYYLPSKFFARILIIFLQQTVHEPKLIQ